MEYRLRQVANPATVTVREVFSNGVLYVENNEVTTTRQPWMLEMVAHRGYSLITDESDGATMPPKRGRGRPRKQEVTETKES